MRLHIFLILAFFCILARSQTTDRSVIIVGAGLAGYSAAQRLLDNGYTDITILESLNRVGGRVYSIPFSGGMIDLGAQWVHGETGNSIFNITSRHYRFGSTPMGLHWPTFLLSNGTTPRQTEYTLLYGLGHDVLQQIYATTRPTGNLGDLFLTLFNQAVQGPLYRHINPEITQLIRNQMHMDVLGYFSSATWFDISMRLTNELSSTGGDQYVNWNRDGFIKFFDFLTRKLPNPSQYLNIESRVRFNKHVTNIRYNLNDPSSRVTVTCSDGTAHTARHVIFTGSLGVLKKHHQTLFTPALPAAKVRSINFSSFGNIAKFFMEYSHPFWPTRNFLQYSFMWQESHQAELVGTDREYLLGIAGIFIVDQYPNLLQVFLAGPRTLQFEQTSNQKVTDDMAWLFDRFLPSLRPIPRPINVSKTQWLTGESFLGSYTYPSMNQETNSATVRDLASTLRASNGSPTVLFAGEATSLEFASMSHGAVDDGFRAASEIVSFNR